MGQVSCQVTALSSRVPRFMFHSSGSSQSYDAFTWKLGIFSDSDNPGLPFPGDPNMLYLAISELFQQHLKKPQYLCGVDSSIFTFWGPWDKAKRWVPSLVMQVCVRRSFLWVWAVHTQVILSVNDLGWWLLSYSTTHWDFCCRCCFPIS